MTAESSTPRCLDVETYPGVVETNLLLQRLTLESHCGISRRRKTVEKKTHSEVVEARPELKAQVANFGGVETSPEVVDSHTVVV
jgi:hypothetical protein